MTRTRITAIMIAAGALATPALAQAQYESQQERQQRQAQQRQQQDRQQAQQRQQQNRQQMQRHMQGGQLDWQGTRIVGVDIDNDGRVDALYELNAYEVDSLRDRNEQQQMARQLSQQMQQDRQGQQSDWRTQGQGQQGDWWTQETQQGQQSDWRTQQRQGQQGDWWTQDTQQGQQSDWRTQQRQDEMDWRQQDRQFTQQGQQGQSDWRTQQRQDQQDWRQQDRQFTQQQDWRQQERFQRGQTQRGQIPAQQARQMLNQPITASGTIQDTRTFRFQGDDNEHLVAKVSTDDNRQMVVDLGPASDLRDRDIDRGKDIAFRAYRGNINNRPVYFADAIQLGNEQFRVQQNKVEPLDRISGQISDTREVELQNGEGTLMLARIRTQDGESAVVSLGKKGEIDDSKIQQGKEVEVLGMRGRLDGRPIYVAERVHVDGETLEVKHPKSEQHQRSQSRSQSRVNR